MAKLLFILIIIALIYGLTKLYRSGRQSPDKRNVAKDEDMVRCEHCGIHLPLSESIASEQEYFCCEEHRRLRRP